MKKPFNEQPRIKIQGKSDQNAAYEKNFPRYLTLGIDIIRWVYDAKIT